MKRQGRINREKIQNQDQDEPDKAEIRPEFGLETTKSVASYKCLETGRCPEQKRLQPGLGFRDNTSKYRCKSYTSQQTNRRLTFTPYKKLKRSDETVHSTRCVISTNCLTSKGKRRSSDSIPIQRSKTEMKKDVNFLNQTYPPAGQPRCITKDADLEMDTIIPMEITATCTQSVPQGGVPSAFKATTTDGPPLPPKTSILHQLGLLRNKDPDQRSTIYIPHKYADRPIGDEFGADVWTFKTKQKDGTVYHQHYFVNVKPEGPAEKMKILDNDEIILLNDKFVPDVTHNDLLNLFHKVKVDGKTRFRLILRRLGKERSKKEWEWINTSAILAPDYRHDHDKYPEVEHPKFTSVTGAGYEMRSVQYYKVPGTQRYLDIKRDCVCADVWTNTDADKTKRILRRVHFTVNTDHHVQFTAALYSEISSKYIVVDQQRVKLDNNPMWFDMTTEEPNIIFQKNGRYLAFNRETHQVEVHDSEYKFEEVPAKNGIDHPDHSVMMNSLSQNDDVSACNSVTFPLENPVACGFTETSKDTKTTQANSISPLAPVSSKMSFEESVYGNHGVDTLDREKMSCTADDTKCVKDASESKTSHMTLVIPNTDILHVRRSSDKLNAPTTPSSDKLKTPTTPFSALFIVN